MSVQALVTRVLQDQHLELRSDILASNRDFAKKVAEEIHAKQRADEELNRIETPPPQTGIGAGVLTLVLLLGLLPAVVLFVMLTQVGKARDALVVENARLAALAEQRSAEVDALWADLWSSNQGGGEANADARYGALLEALQWAVNQSNGFGYDELPFDDIRLERLRELLGRLATVGFTGTVRLDAHLGEFCLANDAEGGYRLADSDTLVTDCVRLGHPLGASGSPSERQSLGFANFLATSPLVTQSGIDVQLVAHGERDSVRRHSFSPGLRTAGEWNRVAALNNRVEFTLIPR
jgi:hypothetical protein